MANDEIFGDVISSYTAEQAVADGVLFHPYPQRWPWLLISVNVHAACNKGDHGRNYDQCLVPLLMDAIMAAQAAQRSKRVKLPLVLEGTIAGKVYIEPNEMGGMTVFTPEER